jgi:hypothetical protein
MIYLIPHFAVILMSLIFCLDRYQFKEMPDLKRLPSYGDATMGGGGGYW